MPEDHDMPDIDENEMKYFRAHNPDNKKPDIVKKSANDNMPDIDENEMKYFRAHNPDNEKPDIVKKSANNNMPDIDENEMKYFRSYNPTNLFPNINKNQIISFPIISKQLKVTIPGKLDLGQSSDNKKIQNLMIEKKDSLNQDKNKIESDIDDDFSLEESDKTNKVLSNDTREHLEHEKNVFYIGIKENTVFRFPKIMRNVICKHIFELLVVDPNSSLENIVHSVLDSIKNRETWTNDVPIGELNEFIDKYNENIDPLFSYLSLLFEIVKKLKNISNKNSILHIQGFIKELLQEQNISDMSSQYLVDTIRSIFDHLRSNNLINIRRQQQDFGKKNTIPINVVNEMIEKFKDEKKWHRIMKKYASYGHRFTLIRSIKDYLGEERFQDLLLHYSERFDKKGFLLLKDKDLNKYIIKYIDIICLKMTENKFRFSAEESNILYKKGIDEILKKRNTDKHTIPILIYLFIQYKFNYNLNVEKICDCLKLSTFNFQRLLRRSLKTFFDMNNYRDNVYKYLDIFIERLKELQYVEEKDDNIINECKIVFSRVINQGFSPFNEEELNRIDKVYFYPQYSAISLLFATLKSKEEIHSEITPTLFESKFKGEPSWESLSHCVYDLLKRRFENLLFKSIDLQPIYQKSTGGKIIEMDNDEFISELNQLKKINKNNQLEIEMILNLFILLDGSINPEFFIEQLEFQVNETRGVSLASCLYMLKVGFNFRYEKFLRIKENLSKLFKEEKLLQAIEYVNNVINTRIRYSRDNFIYLLESNKIIEEINLLLTIYQMVPSMTPKDFIYDLNIYGGDIYKTMDALLNKESKFLSSKTYNKIRDFINENISNLNDRNNALCLLQKLEESRETLNRDFMHFGIMYKFAYIPERLNQIHQKDLKDALKSYLIDVLSNDILDEAFGSQKSLRISNLKVIGFIDDKIDYRIIKGYFLNKTIFQTDCKFITTISWKYKMKYHNEIESQFLKNDSKFIAIELPLFLKLINSDYKFLTGHIDMIFFQDKIIVCDIKYSEQEIYKSIPQLTLYGIVLQKILLHYGCETTVKCVGLTQNLCLEFDPNVMQNEILLFLDQLEKTHKNILIRGNEGKTIRLRDVIEKTCNLVYRS